MDVLDPLGTFNAVVPHSTSFSSNIYLLKREAKTLTKGQLINTSEELNPLPEEKIYFTVGKEINKENFSYQYRQTALSRIFGFGITCNDGKISLCDRDNSVAFGRVYVVDKSLEIVGVKIGTYQDIEVWGNVQAVGNRSEGQDGVWEIMKKEFGESSELAYYWYLETGVFYGQNENRPALEEEVKILEDLRIGELLIDKKD
ncbi:hypothetical protein SteCoe_32976 [Stentor coeruleus]|uniref:Uncharacterized protein n=1 Tax=Stentor coeruleus TaxID=5963 RepID=A0A1R2AXQ7_9CILI|nr:hypothetical protein SteCoe_32976 [Stentor coeruleus]